MPGRRSTLRAGPWRGRSVRPGRRKPGRASQVQAGLRDAIRSRGEARRPFSGCFLSGGAECLRAGRSEDSEASQATNPVVAWLPSRGAGSRIGAPGGAVRHGGGRKLPECSFGWQCCGTWGWGEPQRPNGPQHTRCGCESTGGRTVRETVVAAGARGSRHVGPPLGSATVDVATLLQASKHFGPGGFPRAARRRDHECVVRLFQVLPPRNLGGGPCLRSGQWD